MMKNLLYLSSTELYIIIRVREIRLELGISGDDLSKDLGKNQKYIGHIESSKVEAKYSDQTLNIIAFLFGQKAKEYQAEADKNKTGEKIKTEYTILDFYPKSPLPDEKVLKQIDPISRDFGPTATLNAAIETTDFFNTPKTLDEIVSYCNSLQNKNWKASDFTRALDRAVKINKTLQITIVQGSKNGYHKAESQ